MSENFKQEELRAVIRKLSYTDRLHHCCVEKYVQELGIHRNQHMILMCLSREQIKSQKEIAEKFHISTAAVAGTLKSLEKSGYILRETCEDDTRKNIISITGKGREVIDKSQKYFDFVDSAMIKGITREEFDTFNKLMEIFQGNLKHLAEIDIDMD